MRIRRSGVEVIGDRSPSVVEVEIDRTGGVVGVEHDVGGHQVVGWVKRVKRCAGTIHKPKQVRTFITVKHPSTVGVRVGPIRSGLVFNGVRNTVAVKVVGLDVV